MDMADMYDWEIVKIGEIWNDLNQQFAHKPNTKANLQEFAKVAHEKFLKEGFVVNVKWELNLVVNPATMQPYPIEVEVLGRAPGAEGADHATDGFDHERKRHEVLRSKERGEDIYGQRERATG